MLANTEGSVTFDACTTCCGVLLDGGQLDRSLITLKTLAQRKSEAIKLSSLRLRRTGGDGDLQSYAPLPFFHRQGAAAEDNAERYLSAQ